MTMSVVLVTGASSGIGLATALHFARKGAAVYAGLRNPEGAVELQQAVAAEGLPITPVRIDVDKDDSVRQGVQEVLEKAGRIEVLVNNAGVGGGGPIELIPLEAAKRTFETNYFGVIRMIQSVLPGMRERRSGTIVNISSLAGRVTWGAHGHYSASKHALEAASEALAIEVRPYDIRVAIIEPGVILTPIFSKRTRNAPTEHYEDPIRRLRRFFEKQLEQPVLPEAVAEAVALAVETDTPRLRYLVGEDAEVIAKVRRQITDEAWVEDGSPRSDEAFFDRMFQRYGVEFFREGDRH
jgi:NAD(P)-dependent dehydrogenase (short-subunit alcohol dehydrogenase family)